MVASSFSMASTTPSGARGRYAEKGRHIGDGLNVAGVDYKLPHSQYVVQVRAFLQFDGMVACAPFFAVHEAIPHIPLHIRVYATPIQGIEQLHPVTDAEHGAVHAQASAEKCSIGGGAHRLGFFYIVGQLPDHFLRNGRASGDDQAVKQVCEGMDGLLPTHGCNHRNTPRIFHGTYVVAPQPLFASARMMW